ncbi:WD40-repeat-containing domain protein [Cladochytrium replicatum]|nr:WD40-repeat-containing domain protein [Cladochytrium replicatum]
MPVATEHQTVASVPDSILEAARRSVKRTHAVFRDNATAPDAEDPASQRIKLASKVFDEYEGARNLPDALKSQQPVRPSDPAAAAPSPAQPSDPVPNSSQPSIIVQGGHQYPSGPGAAITPETAVTPQISESSVQRLLDQIPAGGKKVDTVVSAGVVALRGNQGGGPSGGIAGALIPMKEPRKVPKPKWHAPWKLLKVIAGHQGWVRSIAVEPGNEWFVTGAGDRVIKVWDLASGQLKLSLTGHISTVRGLAVSPRHPYLFSAGEDKMVKCWDLEYNKVIRHYHGHLSGVYCLALHPTLDILITGGRDACARVWDMRTKAQIYALTGHNSTVADIQTQAVDPQIMTGSSDSTIRLWDLAAGKTLTTLTHHKKSVRAMALHPREFTFASASADNIKQWKLPEGKFIQNFEGHKAIVNTMCVNEDGVVFSGADNGSMHFWDWKSGYNFQRAETLVQPGSLSSESGIFCSTFDHTGSRLITGEADKTIKIWKEDDMATPETHPIDWKPSIMKQKY